MSIGHHQKIVWLVSCDRFPSQWKKCKKLTWAFKKVFGKLNLNKDILLEIKTIYLKI